MKVNILGTEYELCIRPRETDQNLEENDGYCDESVHLLSVADLMLEQDKDGSKKDMGITLKKVVRHEIVHAFLCESGLAECSDWAQNEEMVDWVAKQGPKIHKAWMEAVAL